MSALGLLASAPPPLTGFDEFDDPVAVEAFRLELRSLRMTEKTGVLHPEVRIERGHRRQMKMDFITRVEGSSTRKRDVGPPPGVPDRRKQ